MPPKDSSPCILRPRLKSNRNVIIPLNFKQRSDYTVTFAQDKQTMAKPKQILSTLVVLFLLIGLPVISYYYLSQGYQYRKDAIMTQGDFGKMPDLSGLPAVRGEQPEKYRGAMTVVGWLDPTKPVATKQYGQMLDSLYQQFANSPNLYFMTITRADDAAATAAQFATAYHLPDTTMINFVRADDASFAKTARDFQLPLEGYGTPGEAPIVALVDSSLTVVKHYNLAQRNETIGLVELISVIIPLPERKDIILKRTKEL